MYAEPIQILLADDDNDDCLLFKEALKELSSYAHLTIVNDGEQLMLHLLENSAQLPHVLFLDLNLPRKNGIECLSDIKANELLKQLQVIIYSTSAEQDFVNLLYANGALYYIRKPAEFTQLKKVISQALQMIAAKEINRPVKEQFILTGDL